MWGIIAVSLWIGCAFNTLIYIAGLQSIDTDVYEAADMVEKKVFKCIKSNHDNDAVYAKRYKVYTELYPKIKRTL